MRDAGRDGAAAGGDAGSRRPPPRRATLIFTGGAVWTGEPGRPTVEAVALAGDRILAAGTDAEVRALAGPGATEIALRGRLVVPGLMDSHTHFVDSGFYLAGVDLRDADSPEAFTRRLADYAAAAPAGRWILGGSWDHERWPGTPLPRREWIDAVTPDNPVFVMRLDAHMAVANTVALKLAGITRDTPDPPGGTIVRDPATGEPTGVLKDDAMPLMNRVIPEPTPERYDEAVSRAQRHALALGVTHITNMGTWEHLDAFRRMRRRGELRIRACAFVQIPGWARLRDHVAEHGRGDARLRWGGLKAFVDGSLGSHTAWFHEPYRDAPDDRGLQITDPDALRQWIRDGDAAGLQVAAHAIGDAANDWILDVFQETARRNGARDRRFRVEHAQHLSAAALPRFAQLGVLASMQPYHAIDDGRWAERRIEPERLRRAYPFRSLLQTGATLLFGSDWPVAPVDPVQGIYAAVTRRTPDGAHPDGWIPEQKIPVEAALAAYTRDAARGVFLEDSLGTLAPGKLADLVVLSANILEMDPVRIPEARVDCTVVDGEMVYRREDGGD